MHTINLRGRLQSEKMISVVSCQLVDQLLLAIFPFLLSVIYHLLEFSFSEVVIHLWSLLTGCLYVFVNVAFGILDEYFNNKQYPRSSKCDHCKKPFLCGLCVWSMNLYACVCVCDFFVFICFILLFNSFCFSLYFSLSLLLCILNLCWDELLSISVPFKVIVYFSTTIHISKHYTVQTFNLDSHKPFRGEDKKKQQRPFQSGRASQRSDSIHAHAHALAHSYT